LNPGRSLDNTKQILENAAGLKSYEKNRLRALRVFENRVLR
jgi:hypothetical protein